jgi:hypothetical protein
MQRDDRDRTRESERRSGSGSGSGRGSGPSGHVHCHQLSVTKQLFDWHFRVCPGVYVCVSPKQPHMFSAFSRPSLTVSKIGFLRFIAGGVTRICLFETSVVCLTASSSSSAAFRLRHRGRHRQPRDWRIFPLSFLPWSLLYKSPLPYCCSSPFTIRLHLLLSSQLLPLFQLGTRDSVLSSRPSSTLGERICTSVPARGLYLSSACSLHINGSIAHHRPIHSTTVVCSPQASSSPGLHHHTLRSTGQAYFEVEHHTRSHACESPMLAAHHMLDF